MPGKRLALALAFSLFATVSSAASRTLNMSLAPGPLIDYTVSSASPSASDFISTTLAGTIDVEFFYSPPSAGTCPTVTAVSLLGGGLTVQAPISLGLNWGTFGTYTYGLTTATGHFDGTSLPVSGTSIDMTGVTLTVDAGELVESGTGTYGSLISRTTDFSVTPKYYDMSNATGVVWITTFTYDKRNPIVPPGSIGCRFNVAFNTPGGNRLWTSPTDVDLGFVADFMATQDTIY